MSTFKAYGERTPFETKREKANRTLAREVAQEGIVLLENDGVLPIEAQNISLYGSGARMTIRGGTGSGDTSERYSVSIEEGLINNGFMVSNGSWLDKFDNYFEEHKSEWKKAIEEKIKDYTMENILEMFEIVHGHPLSFPVGPLITEEDIDRTANTAVLVIARQAGEGQDRKNIEGDFKLDPVEVKNLNFLAKHYQNLIIVLNCGGLVDLSPLDKISVRKAVIHLGQCGMEGGNALAKIISGQVTPSGKLTDTWAYNYEDYPVSQKKLQMDSNKETDYLEGIFVGYRYFDTFNVSPRYEFGYGLSYTNFLIDHVDTQIEQGKVILKVNVKNNGHKYSGKEVVQIYLSKANRTSKNEMKKLVAFEKTKLLKPNENQVLAIEIPLNELAVFSDDLSAWIVEADKYGILIGNSSRQLSLAGVLEVEEICVVEEVDVTFDNEIKIYEWKAENIHTSFPENIPTYRIDKNLFVTSNKKDNSKETTDDLFLKFLKELSVEELAQLCVGGGQFGITYHQTPGAVGWTTMGLIDKGIPNINFADGPAGLNLINESVIEENGTHKYLKALPEKQRWGIVKEMEKYALGSPENGTPVYQYMTSWPAIHVQAQSWNKRLSERIGEAIGQEMLDTGVTLWLAPAINIHRDPLCGRNFEYYSEDPLVSGVLAACVTRGVQKMDGIGVTIKHFCCNNQENQRHWVSANVSDKALREIYLKAFKHVIDEANPLALMSSYNKVNGEYVVNNKKLLKDLLRKEWGFKGLIMSDWHSAGEGKADYVQAIKSGNDLIMPGNPEIVPTLIKAYESNELEIEDLRWCAQHVLQCILNSNVYKKDKELSLKEEV